MILNCILRLLEFSPLAKYDYNFHNPIQFHIQNTHRISGEGMEQ